jgi:hypothetical protein
MEFILVLRSVMYRLGSIESQVVRNADKVLCPISQVFGFLGTCSWRPATAGVLRLRPHSGSPIASLSLVSPHSAAARLVVAAVSSEIADAAAETALMAAVNSATVAELLLVLPEFLAAFIARIS